MEPPRGKAVAVSEEGAGRGEGSSPGSWSTLSEEELLARAQGAATGDTRAFDELVRRHQGHIRANCRFIVNDPEASLDLAQEVFVKAYFGLASFQARASWKTWLRRIKVNHCLSYRESRWSRRDLSLEELQPSDGTALLVAPTAPASLEAEDTRDRVLRVLDRIPDTLRIPLVLRDMDELSYEEIREMLGIGLSAVKMRIKRGREAFREAWKGDGE